MKKKFPRPRKKIINKKDLQQFLKGIGFQTEEIHQEWRHVTAFGIFEGKEAVFKLASTITTSKRTLNEFNWNEAVHQISQRNKLTFAVPKNFSSGYYGKLFYFIAQRFSGKPIAKSRVLLPSNFEKQIKRIALITREIELLQIPKDTTFFKTQSSNRQESIGQRLLDSASEWASQVPMNLEKFLKQIRDAKDKLRTSPAHGDFVIRQMYELGDKIGIIDGEHAGIRGVYHYDAAQFYIRLHVDYRASVEARQYLHYLSDLLPSEERNIFWQELKPVLIQRYIGELWGSAKDGQKLKELEQLGQDIIDDRIF